MRRVLAAWLLPRYASGGLPGPLRRLVARTLDDDDVLVQRYELLRRAERVAGKNDGLSAGQSDLLLASIFDDVTLHERPARAPALTTWMPALGAAASVALLVLVAKPTSTDGAQGDLTARAALLEQAPLGVRIRCVAHDQVLGEATSGARQTGMALACPADGLLAFSTTNLSKSARHAFVVAIDAHGDARFLPPFSADASSVAMAPGTTDEVLPTLAPVPDGDVTLFVLLSDTPLQGADVERSLQQAKRAAVSLDKLERLPLDVPVQARVMLGR
jgi:hypothetical protein